MKHVFQTLNQMTQAGIIDHYCIGGSVGYICYVEPFLTQDIDVFVMLPQDSFLISLDPIYRWAEQQGFVPEGDAIRMHGELVQFIVAPTNLEEDAITSSRRLQLFGEPVQVMSPEYLICTSLRAGRAKDYAKIEKMLQEHAAVDLATLYDLITQYELENKWERAKPATIAAPYRALHQSKMKLRRLHAQEPFSFKVATLERLRTTAQQFRHES